MSVNPSMDYMSASELAAAHNKSSQSDYNLNYMTESEITESKQAEKERRSVLFAEDGSGEINPHPKNPEFYTKVRSINLDTNEITLKTVANQNITEELVQQRHIESITNTTEYRLNLLEQKLNAIKLILS
jgi:hypothetical protein